MEVTPLNFKLIRVSKNSKTGPIPVSITSEESCPDACPFKALNVCYAKYGPLRLSWNRVNRIGDSFAGFLDQVRKLPKGTLWRHNQAGDLPGIGDRLDCEALGELVKANKGRRGYTYTHKPLNLESEREAIRSANANANGFTVNLSGNDLSHADELADLGIGPVVTVLPSTVEGPIRIQTPKGRPVVVCPATYREDVTCSTCGACAVANRKSIIGFPAHGTAKRKYDRYLPMASS
jgi:ferredoxin